MMFFAWFGILSAAAITAAAVWLAAAAGLDRLASGWAARSYDHGVAAERARLHEAAGWFGEDRPTMELVHDLARGTDAADARRYWRRASGRGK